MISMWERWPMLFKVLAITVFLCGQGVVEQATTYLVELFQIMLGTC